MNGPKTARIETRETSVVVCIGMEFIRFETGFILIFFKKSTI